MKTSFTIRERYINKLVLNSMNNRRAIGLLNGQMGVLIVIARYARRYKAESLEHVADILLENVMNKIAGYQDKSFSSGLIGICWGIEYLSQKNIIPGSADEFCHEADKIIIELPLINTVNIEQPSEITGYWHYIANRIQGNHLANLPCPFPAKCLTQWLGILRKYSQHFPSDAHVWLKEALNNNVRHKPQSLKQFIKLNQLEKENELSLESGIAGYIEKYYL